MSLDRLMQPERHYTSAASGIIHRRVMIRSKPSLLMANYSKIKRVRPPWSCITVAVEGNWNLEEQEDIGEVEKGTEKLRRETAGRLDKDNVLESKTTRDRRLHLQSGKRLETRP